MIRIRLLQPLRIGSLLYADHAEITIRRELGLRLIRMKIAEAVHETAVHGPVEVR